MLGEIEMANYEGTCKYCGLVMPILAVDQIGADTKNSEQCSCGGYEKEQRLLKAKENITSLFGEKCTERGLRAAEQEVIELLIHIAHIINEGKIQSATINLGGAKAAVTTTAKGKIKIVRTDSRQQSTEA